MPRFEAVNAGRALLLVQPGLCLFLSPLGLFHEVWISDNQSADYTVVRGECCNRAARSLFRVRPPCTRRLSPFVALLRFAPEVREVGLELGPLGHLERDCHSDELGFCEGVRDARDGYLR